MTTFQWFSSLVLAATIVPALAAETRCPGNAASVPSASSTATRSSCPYPSTTPAPTTSYWIAATQITMIDPSLASELHLDTQDAAVVAGAGSRQSTSFAQLDLVEAGSHAVAHQRGARLRPAESPFVRSAHSGHSRRGFPRALRHADRQSTPPALSRQLGRDARRGERDAYPAGCSGLSQGTAPLRQVCSSSRCVYPTRCGPFA